MLKDNVKNIKSLASYLLPYKYKLLLGVGILFCAAFFELVNPKLFREIVNGLNKEVLDTEEIYRYLAIIIGIVIIKGGLIFFSRYILISISRRVEYDIRNKLFKHMLCLPASFSEKNKTGDIISRLTSDIEHVRMIFGPGIMYTFNVLFILILAFWSMYVIDVSLSIYVIIPLLMLSYMIWFIGRRYYDRSRVIQEELSNMSNFVNENLEGIRVIKSFVKEELVRSSFNKINKEFIKKNMSLARLSGVFRPTLYLIAGTASIIVLWVGGLKVYRGEFSLGHLVEFLKYIEILSIPLMAFGWVTSLFQRGFASYDRIKDFLQEDTQSSVKQFGSISLGKKRHIKELVVKDLSFTYPGARYNVLSNINFKVSAKEKVAIIGPTGCGKTTLVSLLLRIYEPDGGNIFLDGISHYDYSLGDLRACYGYVPQNNFIFPYTVSENIRFSSASIVEEEVIKLSKMAELHDEIELFPNAYSEYIGERGVTLSGGQKQRLAIARALAQSPPILIFDDSFSAIDASTESKILSNIESDYPTNAIIIIAHRLSTIKNVDKIIILENGRITNIGSPEKLSKGRNYYRSLIEHEKLVRELGI